MFARITVDENRDLLEVTARHLIDQFASSLPDLRHVAVLLPDNHCARYFRHRLLAQLPDDGPRAVIPPWLGTVRDWINASIRLPDTSLSVISEQSRRLMFIEALEQSPAHFRKENKWQVALSLLKLFDELNLGNATISDSADKWTNRVQRAYGMDQQHTHLEQEASLTYTLWHAWHQQLHENGLLDHTSAYIMKLRHALQQLDAEQHFYVATTEGLAPCETGFIDALCESGRCTVIDYATQPAAPANTVHDFITRAFAYEDSPLKDRTEAFGRNDAQLTLPFTIFPASSAEHEARAVDLQIRKWLLEGKHTIGVVCEDRKLSRRLRALLERANVPLQDMAGWSLSTTSAAAVLERWLECIEEDFDQRPMLDLCKSHFFSDQENNEERLENIYRLERDIIQHENIGHGLTRYKEHLGYRLNRLEHWPANAYDDIVKLLNHLDNCASPLIKLRGTTQPRPLTAFLDALLQSLDRLGIESGLRQDPAGMRIMQTLADMRQSLEFCSPKLLWSDFRTWLGMTLEEKFFSPQAGVSAVQLMTLEQASLKQFDALVIAAADDEHMPGSAESSPFFNQGARKLLGLDDWESKRERRLTLFRRLLLSAPDILISYKAEENGETLPASAWIESLLNFYTLSYGRSLVNTELDKLLEANPAVFICDTDSLPPAPQQPGPVAPASLSPKRISAGAHQRLINCPYQFFSGDALGLKPSDEISEELKKSNYGERVHLILQAFHKQVRNLPPPFEARLTPENRQAAIEHLAMLSQTVFKKDLEDNSLHRSWLYRWLKQVPAYIDWQMQHQDEWAIRATENKLETSINDATTIFGRLDRIDTGNKGEAIIDYKTGKSANQKNVDNGEDVQLTTYALLNEKAEQVMFLSLDDKDGRVKAGASLAGEELHTLSHAVGQRLQTMLEMTGNGAPLHAWGDAEVCRYCNFSGLCRRTAWKE